MAAPGKRTQLTFNTGEVTPVLAGRTDVERVVGGCRKLQNMTVELSGAAIRRAGLEYIASIKGTSPGGGAEFVSMPLWHEYVVSDSTNSYRVGFRGVVQVRPTGHGARFIGHILAANNNLVEAPVDSFDYRVWMGSSPTVGAYSTIGSVTGDGTINEVLVAVDVDIDGVAGRSLHLVFGNAGEDESSWTRVAALTYPGGWNFPIDILTNPGTMGGNGANVRLMVASNTLEMDWRFIDDGVVPNLGGFLFSWEVAVATWGLSSFILHYQRAGVGVSIDESDSFVRTIPGAQDGLLIEAGYFISGTNVRVGHGRLGPFLRDA